MSSSSDAAYLADMLEYARGAAASVEGVSAARLAADTMLRLATERRLEIIGEAAGKVSEATRLLLPAVPFKSIVGARNIISHGYRNVDYAKVLKIIRADLPPMIAAIEAYLAEHPPT